MVHIFISYAREDKTRIQPLVRALEKHGWSVFWDQRIPAGETWRSYIGKALDEASCVIVVWSHHSIVSRFVSEEAEEGLQRGVLVPVLLDKVVPPLGFRSIHAANLVNWDSTETSQTFQRLATDVTAIVSRELNLTARKVRRREHYSDDDWQSRILCGDGNCIGIIGINGHCNVCGKRLEETNTPETADYSNDWDNRVLCSDGNCIGIMGPDGRCTKCRRRLR